MFVTPAPGLIVLDPITMQPLPAEGADVPDNEIWQRRLRDGDVAVAARKGKPTAAHKATANNDKTP